MTNTNFYVKAEGKEYILRIPGACTDIMIDRKSERHNGALASDCGINVPTLYFDADTGVKVTRYIPDAVTLNGKSARLETNIRRNHTAPPRTAPVGTSAVSGVFGAEGI